MVRRNPRDDEPSPADEFFPPTHQPEYGSPQDVDIYVENILARQGKWTRRFINFSSKLIPILVFLIVIAALCRLLWWLVFG